MSKPWMTQTALMSALLVISAWISLPNPFSPVPITLQSLIIFLIGLSLPSRQAQMAYGLYLLLGLIGLPVFANFRSGVEVLVGPTGGYLLGFYVAIRFLALSKLNLWLRLGIAQLLVYGFGVLGLMFVLQLTLTQAFILGVLPYLIGDIIKLILVRQLYLLLKVRFQWR